MLALNIKRNLNRMTSTLIFEPSKELLTRMSGLTRGASWDRVESLMNDLVEVGFSEPQLAEAGSGEFTQSLIHSGIEVAMSYASRDESQLLVSSGLAWSICEGIVVDQVRPAIEALLERTRESLGRPTAVIWQIDAWVANGNPPESVIFACFWRRPITREASPRETEILTRTHLQAEDYRNDLRSHVSPLTLAVSLSKDSPGVIGTWSAQSLICV